MFYHSDSPFNTSTEQSACKYRKKMRFFFFCRWFYPRKVLQTIGRYLHPNTSKLQDNFPIKQAINSLELVWRLSLSPPPPLHASSQDRRTFPTQQFCCPVIGTIYLVHYWFFANRFRCNLKLYTWEARRMFSCKMKISN